MQSRAFARCLDTIWRPADEVFGLPTEADADPHHFRRERTAPTAMLRTCTRRMPYSTPDRRRGSSSSLSTQVVMPLKSVLCSAWPGLNPRLSSHSLSVSAHWPVHCLVTNAQRRANNLYSRYAAPTRTGRPKLLVLFAIQNSRRQFSDFTHILRSVCGSPVLAERLMFLRSIYFFSLRL